MRRGIDSVATALVCALLLIATLDAWALAPPVSRAQGVGAGGFVVSPAPYATSEDPPIVLTPSGRPAGVDPITTPYAGEWPDEPGGTHPSGVRTDAECPACHESSLLDLAQSGHGDIPCTGCHQLLDSPNPELLKEPEPQLCHQCHPGDMLHPTTPDHWDFHAGKPLTCTSTCHNPHGSAYGHMLRVAYGTDGKGTDYLCLTCHTEVGITY